MQVRKQQLEMDMKQQTGSKLGKEFVKAVYCHSVFLTYMHGNEAWPLLATVRESLHAATKTQRSQK